jgi:hypothetical protein
MEIILKDINQLVEYECNAKLHPEDQVNQIIKSIQEFGFNDPIAIDNNNIIIEGHGRVQAAKKMGMDQIPAIQLGHLNEQQKKAYILAHNKITMNTGFDQEKLFIELDKINMLSMNVFEFDHILLNENFTFEDYEITEGRTKNAIPLPFLNRKLKNTNKFKQTLKQHYNGSNIFIDLFGGAGLMARELKELYPQSRIIMCDTDNFKQRLDHVSTTNEIITKLSKIVTDYAIPKGAKIPRALKEQIYAVLEQYDEDGEKYIDFKTMSYILLNKDVQADKLEDIRYQPYYNKVPEQAYNTETCKEWLQGIEVVQSIEDLQLEGELLFLVDPPYIGTDVRSYQEDPYWTFKKFLNYNIDLFNMDHDYIYFTNERSDMINLNNFLELEYGHGFFTSNRIMYELPNVKNINSKDFVIFNFKGDQA